MGTISFEDIYGAGTLDTLPGGQVGETKQKTNPNNSEVTGEVKKSERSIVNLKGNLFGQPLMVWLALFGVLFGLKYFVEMKD